MSRRCFLESSRSWLAKDSAVEAVESTFCSRGFKVERRVARRVEGQPDLNLRVMTERDRCWRAKEEGGKRDLK